MEVSCRRGLIPAAADWSASRFPNSHLRISGALSLRAFIRGALLERPSVRPQDFEIVGSVSVCRWSGHLRTDAAVPALSGAETELVPAIAGFGGRSTIAGFLSRERTELITTPSKH